MKNCQILEKYWNVHVRVCAVGNPSAIKGQTANILNLRTGLWVRMPNKFAYKF